MPNRYSLFLHNSTGQYEWLPTEYATHPVFGAELTRIDPKFHKWSGAVNNSTSTQYLNDSQGKYRTNLVLDPATTSVSNYNGRWFGGSGGNGTHTAMTGSGIVGGPATFIRKQWTVANPSTGNVGFMGLPVTTIQGSTYTFSGWIRSSKLLDSGSAVRAKLLYVGGPGTEADGVGLAAMPANIWYNFSVTVLLPSGVTNIYPVVDVDGVSGMAVGDYFDTSGFMLEIDGITNSYFDGNSANVVLPDIPYKPGQIGVK